MGAIGATCTDALIKLQFSISRLLFNSTYPAYGDYVQYGKAIKSDTKQQCLTQEPEADMLPGISAFGQERPFNRNAR